MAWRKLSQIPATNVTSAITGPSGTPLKIQIGRSWVLANSLNALDALANDKLPSSPCRPSGTTYYDENGIARKAQDNGLMAKVCSHCNKTALDVECPVCGQTSVSTPEGQARPMYTASSVRATLAGVPHPLRNRREYLEYLNGDEHITPPTARQVSNGVSWCRDCDRSLRVCPHGEGRRTKSSKDIQRERLQMA